MDLCGLSDPYCDIKLGDLHRKTAVCKHTKEPKWKQQFALLALAPAVSWPWVPIKGPLLVLAFEIRWGTVPQ